MTPKQLANKGYPLDTIFVSSKEQSLQGVMDELYRTTCLVSQCIMAMFPVEAQQVDAYYEGGELWRSEGTSSAWQLD